MVPEAGTSVAGQAGGEARRGPSAFAAAAPGGRTGPGVLRPRARVAARSRKPPAVPSPGPSTCRQSTTPMWKRTGRACGTRRPSSSRAPRSSRSTCRMTMWAPKRFGSSWTADCWRRAPVGTAPSVRAGRDDRAHGGGHELTLHATDRLGNANASSFGVTGGAAVRGGGGPDDRVSPGPGHRHTVAGETFISRHPLTRSGKIGRRGGSNGFQAAWAREAKT